MKRSIKILCAVLGVLFAFALAAAVLWVVFTAGEKLDAGKLALNHTAVAVYDVHGGKIETQSDGEYVQISSLPKYLPGAFVAVEDKRFYDHHGVDYRRMVKATWKNLTTFSFREGASTISQQLIKNTHLTNEKTISRKLKEIKLTRALEKNYSKEEILELYLNSIYFGHSAFGLSSAAHFYFDAEPQNLTPAQSAMLAALVKSPNRYSPFRAPEKCRSRRDFVLSLMSEQGYLTADECSEAKEEPLPESPAEARKENSYLALVYDELSERFPDATSGDSFNVYTYFDPTLQRELEKTEADSDVIVLIRDNQTHGIKALHTTCGTPKRLPASTIKPLAVYAPAMEENLVSPATPVLDEKVDFGGYSPANYGGEYGGYMSVRYALAHSVNVPAVKLLNTLGLSRASGYLEKMDLPVGEEDKTLALALGGMREGYNLPALADAYATFANGGKFTPSGMIARVEDGRGKTLYEFHPEPRRVFSEDVCFLLNDMLQTTAKEGTAKKLKSLPFAVCAKTGTGGTSEGNTDAYTIAYTPADTVAVWLGNRDNSPVNATGGGIPADIALRILRKLYDKKDPPAFPPCENVVQAAFDREEYEENHRLLRADPTAPDYLALHELFRVSALPEGTSTKFSSPKIQKPLISVKNGAVCIELCQTQYYDYEVIRECDGEKSTVYSGRYRKELFDNSVREGKTYTYTVIPYYQGIKGEAVQLPSVFIEKSNEIPDGWWDD